MSNNKTTEFTIQIIHYVNQEGSAAEISYNGEMCAEIFRDNEGTRLHFFPPKDDKYWDFPCDEALKILNQAKIALSMSTNKGTFIERSIPIDPESVNKQAQEILEAILNHPQREIIQERLGRFGDVTNIYSPDGRGARFSNEGEFLGFLE